MPMVKAIAPNAPSGASLVIMLTMPKQYVDKDVLPQYTDKDGATRTAVFDAEEIEI